MNADITYSFLNWYGKFDTQMYHVCVGVCNCEQCRAIRDKRKNRILKKKLKRLLNKPRIKDKYDGRKIYY